MDVAHALMYLGGHVADGVAVLIHELAVALSLFDRVDVFSLHVLDEGLLQGLVFADLADHGWNLLHPNEPARVVPPVAGDDDELVPVWPDHDGLEQALLANALSQLVQGLGVECLAGLARIGPDAGNVDEPGFLVGPDAGILGDGSQLLPDLHFCDVGSLSHGRAAPLRDCGSLQPLRSE